VAALRVKVREFKGQVFDVSSGTKGYKIIEWELDDGTFQYGLDCPLHGPHIPLILSDIFPVRQDEVICPGCKQTYFRSRSKAIVGPPRPGRPFGMSASM
jgi:hypothetical protein